MKKSLRNRAFLALFVTVLNAVDVDPVVNITPETTRPEAASPEMAKSIETAQKAMAAEPVTTSRPPVEKPVVHEKKTTQEHPKKKPSSSRIMAAKKEKKPLETMTQEERNERFEKKINKLRNKIHDLRLEIHIVQQELADLKKKS